MTSLKHTFEVKLKAFYDVNLVVAWGANDLHYYPSVLVISLLCVGELSLHSFYFECLFNDVSL